MIAHVKARYENGVLTPLEPLDLEEGVEVTVSVEEAPPQALRETPAPRQGLAGIVERAKERQRDIPPEEWKDVPPDLAKNHKHYLYGHPKEED
ncbi:MAG: antitoxin family protein [Chloroflexi bacterium]|nr:antitoxin family protein [Chloroflexota bacterium]